MNIQAALESLGLVKKESAIYTALLQLGEASAHEIAIKSGIKRPTVYVVLETLIQKGFAYRSPKKVKQLFIARSPEEVVATTKEKFDQAQAALPLLRALVKQDQARVNALYFDGTEGFKRGLEYRLPELEGKELQIPVRGIVPKHPSLKKARAQDKAFNRTIKVVPFEEYSSKISLYSIADLVYIADYENQQVMVLENAEVSQTVRQIFEMVWAKK